MEKSHPMVNRRAKTRRWRINGFQPVRTKHAVAVMVGYTVLLLADAVIAQSGSRSSLPAPAPKERAPKIRSFEQNLNRDADNIIADVRFRGNKIVSNLELNRAIGSRVGRFFDPDQLQQDVDKLWRMPEIEKINGPYLEKNEQGVVVTFDIVERKHIRSIEFIGNRGITDRALKKQSEIDINQPLDLHKVRAAKNRIEELYKEKGYPKTQVEFVDIEKIEDGDITFLIHEDQQQRVWKVEFVGNTFVSGGRLKSFVNSKPGVFKLFGGIAQQTEIDQDIVRLESYYKSFGFFNARIGREIIKNSGSKWITIRYIIDEGPRYRIRNVSFIGNQVYTADQLRGVIELKPNNDEPTPTFNVAKMNQDTTTLRDLYGSEGFVFSNVQAEPRFLEEPGLLDIVYRIEEGKQYYVGKINVQIEGGTSVTKREVALHRLGFKPGDKINSQLLRAAEARLGAAGVFADRSQGAGPRIEVVTPELKTLRGANGAAGSGRRASSSPSSAGSGSRSARLPRSGSSTR